MGRTEAPPRHLPPAAPARPEAQPQAAGIRLAGARAAACALRVARRRDGLWFPTPAAPAFRPRARPPAGAQPAPLGAGGAQTGVSKTGDAPLTQAPPPGPSPQRPAVTAAAAGAAALLAFVAKYQSTTPRGPARQPPPPPPACRPRSPGRRPPPARAPAAARAACRCALLNRKRGKLGDTYHKLHTSGPHAGPPAPGAARRRCRPAPPPALPAPPAAVNTLFQGHRAPRAAPGVGALEPPRSCTYAHTHTMHLLPPHALTIAGGPAGRGARAARPPPSPPPPSFPAPDPRRAARAAAPWRRGAAPNRRAPAQHTHAVTSPPLARRVATTGRRSCAPAQQLLGSAAREGGHVVRLHSDHRAAGAGARGIAPQVRSRPAGRSTAARRVTDARAAARGGGARSGAGAGFGRGSPPALCAAGKLTGGFPRLQGKGAGGRSRSQRGGVWLTG